MDTNPADDFYQQLDSEDLLKQHGDGLAQQARILLGAHPEMRVAGLIATRDSDEAKSLIKGLPAHQQQAPAFSTLVARRGFEEALTKRWGTSPWLEDEGQPQRVLAVVVATRDGHRFGFFDLADRAASDRDEGSHRL